MSVAPIPPETLAVVGAWMARFAMHWPYHAIAKRVEAGDTAVIRDYAEGLRRFPVLVIENAAIDLRNDGEHFPQLGEWRRRCFASTTSTGLVRESDELPEWMRDEIARQDRVCAQLLDAAGLADAPPVVQGQACALLTEALLDAWTADGQHDAVRWFSSRACDGLQPDVLAWLGQHARTAAFRRKLRTAPDASLLRGTQDRRRMAPDD